jgi:hypothetical protein
MKEETMTFANVKVGDKLWSLRFGEVIITEIDGGHIYGTADTLNLSWNMDGRVTISQVTPDLYFGKPEIIAPPPPKRKVKKTRDIPVQITDIRHSADYGTEIRLIAKRADAFIISLGYDSTLHFEWEE